MEYLFLISRILFGGYFLWNGINHFTGLSGSAGYAASKGVPMPKLAVAGSGILLILGGLGIVLGTYVTYAVIALALFLIPVSIIMHAFWKETDPMQKMNQHIQFTKNMALLGGAIAFMFVSVPWALSVGM